MIILLRVQTTDLIDSELDLALAIVIVKMQSTSVRYLYKISVRILRIWNGSGRANCSCPRTPRIPLNEKQFRIQHILIKIATKRIEGYLTKPNADPSLMLILTLSNPLPRPKGNALSQALPGTPNSSGKLYVFLHNRYPLCMYGA